ncbi:MAG: DUF814 domain-containing protein [Gemmatimonadetes bacterium]|nr:DUF814 domain-containing protein [Gemmatimonadota bacterium]
MSKAIRHDALLARALAAELRAALADDVVEGYRFDRDRRIATLYLAHDRALRFDLHPERGHVTLTRGRPGPGSTRLAGHRIAEIAAPPDERRIHLRVPAPEGAGFEWIVDFTTNRWNAVLVWAHEGRAAQALLAPTSSRELLSQDAGRRAGAHAELDEARWMALLSALPSATFAREVLRTIAYTSSLNIGYILEPATGPHDREGLARAYARWLELVHKPPAPHLLARPWGPQPYPHALGEPDARPVPSLLEVIRELRRAGLRRQDLEEARSEIARRRQTLERRIERLRAQLGRAADSARLQRAADVLLASLHRVPRGAERVELKDFEGGGITIDLDPTLSAAQNADRMYEEARRLRRATQRIPDLLDATAREIERLGTVLERVQAGELPEQVRRWVRRRRRLEKEPGRPLPAPLPYRRYRTSGGFEVRVGKSARDNDELTLHHSSPNDIWMHARGVAGSHVVLRWARRDQVPPERDLLEAAALAAWFSRARTSKVVPVDWTRRRYVRKPRKAPPGTAAVERAETLFVEPGADVERRLRVEDEGAI